MVRQVAKLLAPFGIAPTTVRTATGRGKGYLKEDFEDAFSRYIPDPQNSIRDAVTTRGNPAFSDSSTSVTLESPVTDSNPQEVAESPRCHGVTDENPETWEGEA